MNSVLLSFIINLSLIINSLIFSTQHSIAAVCDAPLWTVNFCNLMCTCLFQGVFHPKERHQLQKWWSWPLFLEIFYPRTLTWLPDLETLQLTFFTASFPSFYVPHFLLIFGQHCYDQAHSPHPTTHLRTPPESVASLSQHPRWRPGSNNLGSRTHWRAVQTICLKSQEHKYWRYVIAGFMTRNNEHQAISVYSRRRSKFEKNGAKYNCFQSSRLPRWYFSIERGYKTVQNGNLQMRSRLS